MSNWKGLKVIDFKVPVKPVVLNRRDASRYRDLETISPGLRTLYKFKLYQNIHKNQVFLYKKTWKIIVTGTIDQKIYVYRDKRLQEIFYQDLNQKRLRTTGLDDLQFINAKSLIKRPHIIRTTCTFILINFDAAVSS